MAIRARPVSLLVATLMAVLLLAPFITGAAAASCSGKVVEDGSWTTIRGPSFTAGGSAMTAYSVDPVDPGDYYATNGRQLWRTSDRGCTWLKSYELPKAASLPDTFDASNSTIIGITVPESPAAHRTVYLTVHEDVLGQPRTHVIRSSNGGGNWMVADTGLPPQGRPIALRVAPSQPSTVYLALGYGGDQIDALFASADGGSTWTMRNNVSRGAPPGGLADFTIDPVIPTSIWAWGAQGLHHSTDGGGSFSSEPEFAGSAAGPADVFHKSGGPARVVAFAPLKNRFYYSANDGKTWQNVTGPKPDSIAHGSSVDQMMITAAGEAYMYYKPTDSWINAEVPYSGVGQAQADRVQNNNFYVRTGSYIQAFESSAGGLTGSDGLPDGLGNVADILTPPEVAQRPSTLAPADSVVRIKAGGSKKIRYRLQLPRTPIPADVFFLMDTSGSMYQEIEGLRQAMALIVNNLAAKRISAQFGLGQSRAYPDAFPPRSDQDEPNFVVRRDVDITGNVEVLEQGLNEVIEGGGGQFDSQLGALWHLTTGQGADLYPPGPLGHDVPPNLDIHWRKNAVHIVLMSTDEPFGTSDVPDRPIGQGALPQPPRIPTKEAVGAALNAVPGGVKYIGLETTTGDELSTRPDMEYMARATGSLAPATGLDCDGDGATDVAGGAPLFCKIAPKNIWDARHMATAVVNLVRAAVTKGDVSMKVVAGKKIVDSVTPNTYPGVLMQASNALDFDVVFRCPEATRTTRESVRFEAVVDESLLQHATAHVICEVEEFNPFEAALALLPAVPPAPPPPLSNLTNATQSQTQAQSQAQAQAAAAAQEEEQPQVAFAQAYDRWQELAGQELEMTAYRERKWPVPPGFVLGAGAVCLSLAFGIAHAFRTSIRPAYARRKR